MSRPSQRGCGKSQPAAIHCGTNRPKPAVYAAVMPETISPFAETGAAVVVTKQRRPALRFEVAAGKRMVLRQQDRAVLFAQAHRWNYGVEVYRTGAFRSPLPPLRSVQVRRIADPEPGSPAWLSRWAHEFLTMLSAAEIGPLHEGRWRVQPRVLPRYCLGADLVVDYPAAELDWFGGWHGVLPLRELPHRDTGRVKAYRKHARDRILAPLLLWWVSGIDGYMLLDGHSRLVAAQAERISPTVLVLTVSPDAELREESRTRAWTLPGGATGWEDQVARDAPRWTRSLL